VRNFFYSWKLAGCTCPERLGGGGGNRQQGPNKAIGFYNDRSIELDNAQEDEINVSERKNIYKNDGRPYHARRLGEDGGGGQVDRARRGQYKVSRRE
jgi:hypothetical protein